MKNIITFVFGFLFIGCQSAPAPAPVVIILSGGERYECSSRQEEPIKTIPVQPVPIWEEREETVQVSKNLLEQIKAERSHQPQWLFVLKEVHKPLPP